MMRITLRSAVVIAGMLLVGGTGGILMDRLLMPWLAAQPRLAHLPLVRDATERTTVINNTNQVVVNGDSVVRGAVTASQGSVVGVFVPRTVKGAASPTFVPVGSGVVITGDGVVAVSAAALDGAATAVLLTADGRRYEAAAAGHDPVTGIAFLRLAQGANLSSLSMIRSEDLVTGQRVLRLGFDPADAGALQAVPSFVTAVAADISLPGEAPRADRWQGLLRMADAADRAGDVYVTDRGEVAGLCVAADDGTVVTLPVSAVAFALDRLRADMLSNDRTDVYGIVYETAGPAERAAGTATTDVRVTAVVPGSAAARAGLRAGDVLTAVDGVVPDAVRTLPRLLYDGAGAATEHTLTVVRQGNRIDVKVMLTVPHGA